MVLKKTHFDICGGNCDVCKLFGCKNLTSAVILTKRKVSKKYVPPDIVAIKMVLESDDANKNISAVSDLELMSLRDELIKNLTKDDEIDD